MGIKVVRLYSGSDGESHIEEIEMPLTISQGLSKDISRQSETIKATGIHFIELDGDREYDFHNTSHRQILITIEGENEIETSDGTKHTLKPGSIFLVEDTEGKGHITRWKKPPHKVIAVTLE